MGSKDVIVIGGGIARLTAGYRRQQEGYSVKVLEARPGVGERMIAIEWEGVPIKPEADLAAQMAAQNLLARSDARPSLKRCLSYFTLSFEGLSELVSRFKFRSH
jgi:monoamine oxidase